MTRNMIAQIERRIGVTAGGVRRLGWSIGGVVLLLACDLPSAPWTAWLCGLTLGAFFVLERITLERLHVTLEEARRERDEAEDLALTGASLLETAVAKGRAETEQALRETAILRYALASSWEQIAKHLPASAATPQDVQKMMAAARTFLAAAGLDEAEVARALFQPGGTAAARHGAIASLVGLGFLPRERV
jgi:hypothetical protein